MESNPWNVPAVNVKPLIAWMTAGLDLPKMSDLLKGVMPAIPFPTDGIAQAFATESLRGLDPALKVDLGPILNVTLPQMVIPDETWRAISSMLNIDTSGIAEAVAALRTDRAFAQRISDLPATHLVLGELTAPDEDGGGETPGFSAAVTDVTSGMSTNDKWAVSAFVALVATSLFIWASVVYPELQEMAMGGGGILVGVTLYVHKRLGG